MDEHGAAAAGDSGLRVVVNLNKQVIEAVIAPQAVAWFTGRPLKSLVIPPVGRIFAPGIGATDAAQRQWRPRAWQAIGPPPNPHRQKLTAWYAAVALAFVRLNAAAPERDGHNAQTSAHQTLRAATWPRVNADRARGIPRHSVTGLSVANFPTPACSCILACSTSRGRRNKIAATRFGAIAGIGTKLAGMFIDRRTSDGGDRD